MTNNDLGQLADMDWPLVVDTLAEIHGLFLPYRWTEGNRVAVAIHERQQVYADAGVRLAGGGGDAAERQAWSRRLTNAKAAGLIRTKGEARALFVKLPPKVLTATESLCGCRMLGDGFQLLERIDQLGRRGIVGGVHCAAARLVPEWAILGLSHDTSPAAGDLDGLEVDLLPYLTSGLVRSLCDSQGRVGYGLTAAGHRYVAKGDPGRRSYGPGVPKLLEAAATRYDQRLGVVLDERATWKPANRNALVVPMSCGAWPAYTGD